MTIGRTNIHTDRGCLPLRWTVAPDYYNKVQVQTKQKRPGPQFYNSFGAVPETETKMVVMKI